MSCSISGLVTERIGAIDVTLARLQAQLLFLTPPVVAASPAYMLSKGAHDPHTHTMRRTGDARSGSADNRGANDRYAKNRGANDGDAMK